VFGPGARGAGDGHGDVLLQAGVAVRVIGGSGLPAAPDDAAPRAAEGPQRTAVVVSTLPGVGVAVSGPGVSEAGGVSEDPECIAQPLVARPAEPGVLAFPGLDRAVPRPVVKNLRMMVPEHTTRVVMAETRTAGGCSSGPERRFGGSQLSDPPVQPREAEPAAVDRSGGRTLLRRLGLAGGAAPQQGRIASRKVLV